MADALDGDFSASRAVLIGTWEYTDTELPDVPAARNSLNRMAALLSGPLGGWPAERLVMVPNRRKRGDLPHLLVKTFLEATDVALFYYVGHARLDNEDRLCLALRDTSTDANLRTTTSLTFDSVHHAFRLSSAKTKIAILDCCFADYAAVANGRRGRAAAPRAPGIYLIMANGEFPTGWFETAEENPRPQTYFTKYFADVIDHGIPEGPPGLTLGPILDRVADALRQGDKPAPHRQVSDTAARFIFARNAVGPASVVPNHAPPEANPSSARLGHGGGFRRGARRIHWRWWHGLVVVLGLAVVTPVVVLLLRFSGHHPTTGPAKSTTLTSSASVSAAAQVTLPFPGLAQPLGIAVDAAGDAYVFDVGSNHVLKLAAGASAPTTLSITDLTSVSGVAVDGHNNVYIVGAGLPYGPEPLYRVWRFAAGRATVPTTLPFTGLNAPTGIAVDAAGDVYIADSIPEITDGTFVKVDYRMLRFAAGSSTSTTLSLTDIPGEWAVDAAGNIYLADLQSSQVLRFAVGSATPTTLPFGKVEQAGGVAVDTAGNVYVADMAKSWVLRLASGSVDPTTLPFTGVPGATAVDASGNIYVVDYVNNRVSRLPARPAGR